QSVLRKITVFVDADDNFAYRLDCDSVVALNQMAQYSETKTEIEGSANTEAVLATKPISKKATKDAPVKKTTRKKPSKEESL
ncbi:MAG: hypothetical protein ABS880_06530, partial [Psychrobacter alimentarius]